MAIHDLWSFDNAPQSSTDISQGTTLSYPNQGTYFQYTNLPGVLYKNTGGTATITSDGFLNLISSSAWNPTLVVKAADVQDWSVATQYWIGFRTKTSQQSAAAGPVFRMANTLAQGTYNTLLAESDMTAAGAAALNTEYYVEIFIDRVNLIYQVWINGVQYTQGAITAGSIVAAGAGFYFWGAFNTASAIAGANRSFRDFYFLDLDSTDKLRFGPIRSSKASLSNVSGSEWVLNSAADLPTALNTVLQSPPVTTPSASAPTDLQPITALLGTSLNANSSIIAVQPQISLIGDSTSNFLDLALTQASQSLDLGKLALPVSANQFNQRWSLQRKAPDGGAWTPSKISATQVVLTSSGLPLTILLTHFDGAITDTSVLDAVSGAAMPLSGGATLTTSPKVFGTTAFQGSASNTASCVTAGSDDKYIMTGDFTYECFFIPVAADISGESILFSKGPGSYLDLYHNGWYVSLGTSNVHLINGVAANLVAGTTYHVALTRSGTTVTLWVNGVSVATASSSLPFGITGSNMNIGNYNVSGYGVKGVLDEARISRVARYTAAFARPTAPFVVD